MAQSSTVLQLPAALKPADGRFGSGPSRVRPEQLRHLAGAGAAVIGTSHRQKPVKQLVAGIRHGLRELFDVPDGYEVALGNGGTTAFWDAATCCLVRERALHLVYGEFSSKFAACTRGAPFLGDPIVISAEPGDAPEPSFDPDADVIAWAHNETSTGVMVPVVRPAGSEDRALVLIDATSAAAGLPVDVSHVDAYYFAPEKGFASDGGLWLALLSPAALARMEQVAAERPSGRAAAGPRSSCRCGRRSRTRSRIRPTTRPGSRRCSCSPTNWIGCSSAAAWTRWSRVAPRARATCTAGPMQHARATPFVGDPAKRSLVVGTIDFDGDVDGLALAATLRANGIVDVEPYRKLGRNQLRIGMFPATDPADLQALTACIDWVLERL